MVRVYIAAFSFILLLILLLGYHQYEDYHNTIELSTTQIVLDKYEKVKDTPVTPNFKDELIEIIRARKRCYLEERGLSSRLNRCRKDYVNDLIRFSRANIKSSPRLGDFLRCVRDCPISAALCKGELESEDEDACLEREMQCIEYCLDEYWRGATTPTGRSNLE